MRRPCKTAGGYRGGHNSYPANGEGGGRGGYGGGGGYDPAQARGFNPNYKGNNYDPYFRGRGRGGFGPGRGGHQVGRRGGGALGRWAAGRALLA
jgi:hypothetical protein